MWMLWIALSSSPAFAGEELPDFEGVVQIPEGTVVTLKGKPPHVVSQFSFLLPEPMFDRALISAKKLALCEPALQESQASVLRWIELSNKALTACEGQFSVDAQALEQLQQQVRTLEIRAVAAETQLQEVRHQRNVAWAITGGLVLGAVAVTAVAVGS